MELGPWTMMEQPFLQQASKQTNETFDRVDIYSLVPGTFLLQLSCPCRQVQLCNPITYYLTRQFISEAMDILCVASIVQQAEQPNYLAEGQIPLY
eukprot:1147857-Pelagomonas_calceolata.AAC.2